ncbi:hypothetical protein QQS21_012547 [Conoideocrella luteorostrata]|uniref:protein-ribulosamine 3-kinase n=1 Tax=Conoideocrella luteorostrata TaxID=1105319 RepID=A0AAJ0CFI6_9HYPO|nr:hypothetical protein QQS21_012547 [Conoideocrella luteorostrata]
MTTALNHMIERSKKANIKFDPGVMKCLPRGSRVLGVCEHGVSLWSRTGKLNIELPDKSKKTYFIKVATGARAHGMMSGEFLAMNTIKRFVPDFVPEPIACDRYTFIPDAQFILYEFKDMIKGWPDIEPFTVKLAAMHRISSNASPGRFGFDQTTYHGNLPQKNDWCDTWEEFFVEAMRFSLRLDEEAKGTCPELRDLSDLMFEKVIPRLLRPVELGRDRKGNAIKPCLVHGDLWFGNFSAERETKAPILYDSCAFWAHNEYEFGDWRSNRSPLTPEFFEAYQKHFPVSWPEEDFDDRNARFNLHDSTLFPSNPQYRRFVIDDMKRLTEKYRDGLEGFTGWAN